MLRLVQTLARAKRISLVLLAALLAAAFAFGFAFRDRNVASSAAVPEVGLFTSLPLLWNEHGQVADFVISSDPGHWAAGVLSQHGKIRALDRITSVPPSVGLLVLAQPRPLSPDENVALDDWVMGGGRLLLFADPMLTQDSAFAIGDKRRPGATVLLSPILARWGLVLEFDETQSSGERGIHLFGQTMPVNLPGRFRPIAGEGRCHALAEGLAVRCSVGKGAVLAVADAALLEPQASRAGIDRTAVLETLLDKAAHD